MQLKPNTLLQEGKYRIVKVLGQGGFGITYLAKYRAVVEGRLGGVQSDVTIAIKEFFMKDFCNRDSVTSCVSTLSDGCAEKVEKFKQKFLKEAISISQLKHDRIVDVMDYFEENNTIYYVMGYVEGGSLGDYIKGIKKHGKLTQEEAVRYICQIASALDFMHKNNITHLDIKPGNVLLSRNDFTNSYDAVLIDFGLAKQYDEDGDQMSSTLMGGSAGYSPIEQYNTSGISRFSPTTDIYALGATLYRLVTNEKPPHANDINETGVPQMSSDISKEVKSAIIAAMQPKRADRPQTISDFLEILGAEMDPVNSDLDDEETEILDLKNLGGDDEEGTEIFDGGSQEEEIEKQHEVVNVEEVSLGEKSSENVKSSNENIEEIEADIQEPQKVKKVDNTPNNIVEKPEAVKNVDKPKGVANKLVVDEQLSQKEKIKKEESASSKITDKTDKVEKPNSSDSNKIEPAKSSNTGLIIGCVAVVLLMVAGGGGYYFFGDTIKSMLPALNTQTTQVSKYDEIVTTHKGVFSSETYEYAGKPSEIEIPDGFRRIKSSAFRDCSNLAHVTIPSSVVAIDAYAFCGCDNLTSVVIPDSVASIGDWAFFKCSNLTSITIPSSVTSIGGGLFNRCKALKSEGVNLLGGNFVVEGGMLFNSSRTEVISSLESSISSSVTLPSSTTLIANGAFSGNSNLASMTIPNSVTEIGDWALFNCSGLSSLTIPSSVTSIGAGAFNGCVNLKQRKVNIKGDRFVMDDGILYNRSKTEAITALDSAVKGKVTLPNTVTSIGDWAFSYCTKLTSITIPNSVTEIGEWSFYYCPNLTSIRISKDSPIYSQIESKYGSIVELM